MGQLPCISPQYTLYITYINDNLLSLLATNVISDKSGDRNC